MLLLKTKYVHPAPSSRCVGYTTKCIMRRKKIDRLAFTTLPEIITSAGGIIWLWLFTVFRFAVYAARRHWCRSNSACLIAASSHDHSFHVFWRSKRHLEALNSTVFNMKIKTSNENISSARQGKPTQRRSSGLKRKKMETTRRCIYNCQFTLEILSVMPHLAVQAPTGVIVG